MAVAYVSLIAFVIIFAFFYGIYIKPELYTDRKPKKRTKEFIWLLVIAFITRIITALTIEGFPSDIACFKSWADMAYTNGLSDFYFTDAFADYPPGYIYVLYIIGFLKNIFKLSYESPVLLLLIKLPSIICDMVLAYIMYSVASKSETGKKFAMPLCAVYLLNPAIIINSSAWGQVDSVYALFVVLFICLLYNKKYILSCVVFTVGFMVKPQGIIFAPVLICYFLYRLLIVKDVKNVLKETGIAAVICLPLMFLIALPFAKDFNFGPIINQYISTIKSYPYASVNAYNLFMALGGNWVDINKKFMFLPYGTWSNIFIGLTVIITIFTFIKSKGEKSYFETGAFVIISVFTLAAKMHERYVYPAMALLIFAFIIKPDKKYLLLYFAVSVTQMINASFVLHQAIAFDSTGLPEGSLPYITAIANIVIYVFMLRTFLSNNAVQAEPKKKDTVFSLKSSVKVGKMVRKDCIILAAITLIYGAVAFVNLGDTKAAETHAFIPAGTTMSVTPTQSVASIKWFTGYTESRKVDLYKDQEYHGEIDMNSVFAWHETDVSANSNIEMYFKQDCDLIEIALFDADGNYVPYTVEGQNITDPGNLNDEKELVPQVISYKNSTYFDEIYHARTAYEYLHGLSPYETTHPPLGKVLISLGIMIFGMCPFGWRFTGTLFGILMLPAIYIFAKRMLSSTKAASLVTLLLAVDFMHFTQTRIATVDVYAVLFIILMFYFMYRYICLSFYDTPLLKTFIPLGLSGLCFGLATASKWTGLYGGAGLCIMFFASIGMRIYEYNKAISLKNTDTKTRQAVRGMSKKVWLTLLFCVGAFVIVPLVIYALSYIPYLKAPNMAGIKSIIDNQKSMFDYHSNLQATHPFSSQWYEWPLVLKPVWYYVNEFGDNLRQSIAGFGNPFVWWTGFGAMLYMFYKCKDKDRTIPLFLVVAYMSGYLPWMGIERCLFIYHYFPCVPFFILAIGCLYKNIKGKKADVIFGSFAIICVMAFIVFYPVLSGMTVNASYFEPLRWISSWSF